MFAEVSLKLGYRPGISEIQGLKGLSKTDHVHMAIGESWDDGVVFRVDYMRCFALVFSDLLVRANCNYLVTVDCDGFCPWLLRVQSCNMRI